MASLQYAAHDLELSAEYSRWIGEFYSRASAIFPRRVENERYYMMASYRVNSWFTPGAYYSAHFDKPPELDTDEAVMRYVASRRGAVGYVSAQAATASVKVIAVH